jgi:hypothetical protein
MKFFCLCNTRPFLILGLFIFSVEQGLSQSITLISGDPKPLSDQKHLMVEYDFSRTKVGNEPESVYLERKKDELNGIEPGKGDYYVELWEKNKTERYEPRFEYLFNKYSKEKLHLGNTEKDAKYTLIVESVNLFPGAGNAIAQVPSYASFLFRIVETQKKEIEVARMELNGVQGIQGGFEPDVGARLQESYSKAGKMLSKFFVENVLK